MRKKRFVCCPKPSEASAFARTPGKRQIPQGALALAMKDLMVLRNYSGAKATTNRAGRNNRADARAARNR